MPTAGYANAPETIYAIVREVPGVINCHEIASGGVVGRKVFVEMHLIVEVPDVETAHRITEEVKSRLQARFSPLRVLIHLELPAYKSDRITSDSLENQESFPQS